MQVQRDFPRTFTSPKFDLKDAKLLASGNMPHLEQELMIEEVMRFFSLSRRDAIRILILLRDHLKFEQHIPEVGMVAVEYEYPQGQPIFKRLIFTKN